MQVDKDVEQQREVGQGQTPVHAMEGETIDSNKTAQAAPSSHPSEEPKTERKSRPTTTSHPIKGQESSEKTMENSESMGATQQGEDTKSKGCHCSKPIRTNHNFRTSK